MSIFSLFFGYLLFNTFGEKQQKTVRLANFIRISEEQWETDISFHKESVNQRTPEVLINIVFVTFSFKGTLASQQKTASYSVLNNMESNLLMSDSLIKVACKFDKLIVEMALVVKHYVQFAFLFVQTV